MDIPEKLHDLSQKFLLIPSDQTYGEADHTDTINNVTYTSSAHFKAMQDVCVSLINDQVLIGSKTIPLRLGLKSGCLLTNQCLTSLAASATRSVSLMRHSNFKKTDAMIRKEGKILMIERHLCIVIYILVQLFSKSAVSLVGGGQGQFSCCSSNENESNENVVPATCGQGYFSQIFSFRFWSILVRRSDK